MLHEGPPGEGRFSNHEQLDGTESPLLATDSDSFFIRDDKRIEEPGVCRNDEKLPLIERLVRAFRIFSATYSQHDVPHSAFEPVPPRPPCFA